uniref:Ig-like domain-containing protein n=1 Tax=Podarcis muralis TaxID=64176 RepID=A0A670K2K2_PODMU
DVGIYSLLLILSFNLYPIHHPKEAQDPSFPKPVLSLETMKEITTGQRVTMLCGTQGEVKRFYLQKDNFHDWSIHSDMNMFTISDVSNKDAGRYSCSYTSVRQPYLLSEPSNPVKLLLTDPYFPRPIISLGPTELVAFGGNVTFQCQSKKFSTRFYIQKSGEEMLQPCLGTDETTAQCFVSNVDQAHTGEYSCRYSDSSVMSRIVMPHAFSLADPDLPRPSISFHPSPMPQLGENITIQCSVNNSYKAWYLYKDDGKKELQSVEASSSDAVFLIKNVSEADGGSYYCNYRPQSGFHHVVLMVISLLWALFLWTDPNLYIPTISMSPSNLVAFGEQVTIRCETGKEAMMFYLHKDGDPSLNWTMETELYHGTLSIHNVSWDNKGSYSCSYVAEKRPKALSLQSDPTELLISGKSLNPRLRIYVHQMPQPKPTYNCNQ